MNITPRIDYSKLVTAVSHYKECGYMETEVPWIVSYDAYSVTSPSHRREFYTVDGYLVASGEQSFIEMMQAGHVLSKNFCITPCFRYEDILDSTHNQYFMKLELIDTDVSQEKLQHMIHSAKSYFEKYLQVEVIQTDALGEAFDIIDAKNSTELGSYGIRRTEKFSWVYGTGAALPRLDVVISQ